MSSIATGLLLNFNVHILKEGIKRFALWNHPWNCHRLLPPHPTSPPPCPPRSKLRVSVVAFRQRVVFKV